MLKYSRKALLERSADGAREIECAVLGNDDPVASVPGEIVPSAEFYDYHAKYLDERTRLIVPADLAPEVAAEIRRMAVAAFRAIDCAGLARVDFFCWESGRAAVNEISLGCTGCPARRPLRAGTATAAAARAVARASSTAITQAACSWATRAGEQERSIGPVDGPAPLIADLASFRQVSDPIHRQW